MRVWVTRDEPEDGPLSNALRARGLTPVLEPVIEQRLVCDPAQAIGSLSRDDWLVLTSPFAIEGVRSCDAVRIPRVAVVGEPSARLARSYGRPHGIPRRARTGGPSSPGKLLSRRIGSVGQFF